MRRLQDDEAAPFFRVHAVITELYAGDEIQAKRSPERDLLCECGRSRTERGSPSEGNWRSLVGGEDESKPDDSGRERMRLRCRRQ